MSTERWSKEDWECSLENAKREWSELDYKTRLEVRLTIVRATHRAVDAEMNHALGVAHKVLCYLTDSDREKENESFRKAHE